MILTVTLNPSIDRSYRVDNFTAGHIYRAMTTDFVAGGKGINVAKVLKTLDEPVQATGFLAGKSGEYIVEQLSGAGIACDFIAVGGETRTSIAILDPLHSSQTEIREDGPAVCPQDAGRILQKLAELLPLRPVVVAAGSIPPGLDSSIYAEIISLAQKNGAKFILDTSGAPLAAGIKAGPFMIKPNREETESLVGYRLDSMAVVKAAAMELCTGGIAVVAISLGEKGAVVAHAGAAFKLTPPLIAVRSPVGSGDAFVAGFAAGIRRGLAVQEAARLATACGAANALHYATGYVKLEDVAALKAAVTIEKI